MEAESELGGYSGIAQLVDKYDNDVLFTQYNSVIELLNNRSQPLVFVYQHPLRTWLTLWLEVNLVHPDMSLYVAYSDQNKLYKGDSLLDAIQAMQ